MSCTLRRTACFVLLAVLLGSPAVAVICAELCAPAEATPAAGESLSCHGRSAMATTISGELEDDCGDHGSAAVQAIASLGASRGADLAGVPAVDWHTVPFASQLLVACPVPKRAGEAPPPCPTPASLVLRI